MTGSLLVTPEELINASQQFSNSASQVNSITNQMLSIVRGMSSMWQGEANTAYTNKFNSLEDDMTKIYKMITEHSNDLNEMARNYQTAEQTNVETSSALQSDI